MSYVQCGMEGCPCGDRGPRNPWHGACGKASNMGFGALTVEDGARPANAEPGSEAAAAKTDCGCGNTIRALKGRVRALMEENVRLEDAKGTLESRIDELEQDPVSRTPFIDAAADRVAVLELRAERALAALSEPWVMPLRVRAILRGDA